MQNRNTIEMIVKDIEKFNFLKNISNYYSDRTKVIVLDKPMFNHLVSKDPNLFKGIIDDISIYKEQKPIVTVRNGIVEIKNATYEILHYLNVYNMYKPIVKIISFPKLFELIDEKIVETDEAFNNVFNKISINDETSKLYSSKGKIKFKKDLKWTLCHESEFISDLNFGDIVFNKKRLKIIENLKVLNYSEEDKVAIVEQENTLNKYEIKFYMGSSILPKIMQPNRIINIAVGSMNLETNTISSPFILPKGLNKTENIVVKSPRKYQVGIYNSAYFEYMYRRRQK